MRCAYTGQEGEGRGRGRGRARSERQGRGRGERKAAAVAAAATAAESTSPIAETAAAAKGQVQEQPARRGRRGADGRTHGGRDPQTGRGRGRAGKTVSGRAEPAGVAPFPAPSVAPTEASIAPDSAAADAGSSQETKTISADPILMLKQPAAAAAPVTPAESSDTPVSKGPLEPPAMPPGLGWDAIAPEPPGLGWGRPTAVPSAVDSGAPDTFLPTNKSVTSNPTGGPDPPVERPKSAAGVVSRPRSSGIKSLQS